MSILSKQLTGCFSIFALLSGCSSAPSHHATNLAPMPVMREELPYERYEQDVERQASYVILDRPYDQGDPYAEAEHKTENEPVASSSADELFERAKALMQVTDHPEDQTVAIELLNQAAEMGHADAMRVLGLLAIKQGPDQRAIGIALLQRSAVTNLKAKRQLGIMYGNLSVIHLDDTDKAIEYFQSASAMGDGESSLYLSKIMTKLGLADDAQKWRALAREQGVEKITSGTQPVSVSQEDSVLKAYSLQRAATAGDASSMYQYALLLLAKQTQGSLMGYEHASEFEAYYWLSRASQMGNDQATEKLLEVAYIQGLMETSKMTVEKLNRVLGGLRAQ